MLLWYDLFVRMYVSIPARVCVSMMSNRWKRWWEFKATKGTKAGYKGSLLSTRYDEIVNDTIKKLSKLIASLHKKSKVNSSARFCLFCWVIIVSNVSKETDDSFRCNFSPSLNRMDFCSHVNISDFRQCWFDYGYKNILCYYPNVS